MSVKLNSVARLFITLSLIAAITGCGGGSSSPTYLLNENFDDIPTFPFQGWTDTGGTYDTKDVTTTTAVSNPNSYMLANSVGNAHGQGIAYAFAEEQPSKISFNVNCAGGAAEGYTNLQDASARFIFYGYCSGYIYNTPTGVGGATFTPNTWYKVELRNIDWTAKTYDFYIDGALVTGSAPFSNAAATGLSALTLYNFGAGGTSYYDDIQVIQ